MVGAALILIWWLFFSRAPWLEQIGTLFVIAAAVMAIKPLVDASISGGFMENMLYAYAVPATVAPALVAWALFSRQLSKPARWATMIATMFLACGAWMLLRTNGITGDAWAQLAWRWTQTAEERLLADGEAEPVPSCAAGEHPGGCRQDAGCCTTVRSAGDGSARARRNNRSEERRACGERHAGPHGQTRRHCGCRGACDGASRVARVPRIGP